MAKFGKWPVEVGSTLSGLQPYKKFRVGSPETACSGGHRF
jgi:hypothetical protein